MKYYLVNYLILENKQVLENERVYIPMHGFASISDFKQTIAKAKQAIANPESIVIKSYKQVSMEEFNSINRASV